MVVLVLVGRKRTKYEIFELLDLVLSDFLKLLLDLLAILLRRLLVILILENVCIICVGLRNYRFEELEQFV